MSTETYGSFRVEFLYDEDGRFLRKTIFFLISTICGQSVALGFYWKLTN